MRSKSLLGARRGAVAVMFGAMAVPITALVGLAIDDGIWNQTYSTASLAMSGAALNAVKVAAHAFYHNDPNYVAEGQAAGKAWFQSQLTGHAGGLANVAPQVDIAVGATVTATVTYSGSVASIFGGRMFGIASYPLNLAAAAAVPASPYLNVEIMLDNSPSMEIGATPQDIYAMQMLTPCSPYGAVYDVPASLAGQNAGTSPAGQSYNAYQCTSSSGAYDGSLACPIKPALTVPLYASWPTNVANGQPTQAYGGQVCGNLKKQVPPSPAAGQPPLAGAPCAFACHFDTKNPPGTGADYYGLARSTIVSPPNEADKCYHQPRSKIGACQITLRFDLVKQAVNQVLATMQTDDVAIDNGDGTTGNLNAGVFTFDTDVHKVYPAAGCGTGNSLGCQAGDDWPAAQTAVGAPPVTKNQTDTGVLPYGGGNVASTAFTTSMGTLGATYLTASGSGTSKTDPAKVLFLVTDGLEDYDTTPGNDGTRVNQPFDTAQCDHFKTPVEKGGLGYTIYVVYTPYYPLMNDYYLTHTMQIAEGIGNDPSPLVAHLQACSSDPKNDFIMADPTDTQSIAKALQKFLIAALNAPARFTE